MALLCLLAGCATTAPQPPAAQPADAATAEHVRAALAADPRLAGREVEVSVNNGVVQLSGIVESTHDLLVVQGDVQAVPGVSGVDEQQLAIRRGGTPP
jgi:osmotically-inducible protein OsmY